MKNIFIVLLGLTSSLTAYCHEPEYSERTDIIHILQAYSDRTGVKFVTDPRVKARVNMIGLKLADLDQTDINKILLLHNFIAYEKSDVVYVIPIAVENKLGKELGTKWESN